MLGDMSEVSEIDAADWALWVDFVRVEHELARELDRRLQRDAGISQGDYAVMITLFEAPDRRLRPSARGDRGWLEAALGSVLARRRGSG